MVMTREEKDRAKAKQRRSLIATGIVATLLVGGSVYGVVGWLQTPPPKVQKAVQEIALIKPPPPPPEDEPPPPPEMEEEEVDVPEPEDMPEPDPIDAPPPGPLGLDAEGVAGADGFGLAGRKGGRSITEVGGSQLRWYSQALKRSILAHLADFEEVRSRRYSVVVSLWLRQDGSVQNVELEGSTGDSNLDQELRMALASLRRVDERPPQDLPQPVRLQVVSRL
ncbi:MAG: energy transducer TonB [Pseudomonadota bacterium]